MKKLLSGLNKCKKSNNSKMFFTTKVCKVENPYTQQVINLLFFKV